MAACVLCGKKTTVNGLDRRQGRCKSCDKDLQTLPKTLAGLPLKARKGA